ncbi:hypothetical protein PV726_47175 [Streptomyces europaeiscabiei]|uniref:hypothetical protein n=1 Tax=Streptomyces europaeiscabiei TaxID=146819 RepID=UPI0029BD94A0|nr:hypothetical protein [Streptomyces europaeiscabiei]MDX3697639.1 hypothetical protein [Streptomyces europaeiscabiei]
MSGGDTALEREGEPVAATERELHEQHRTMKTDLTAQHARVKELDPGDAEFDSQYTAMVQRAQELLAYEQTLPARLAEPQRLRSEQIVRWSWRGQTAVALALITVVLASDRTVWWLLLLIPHLLATLLGWTIKGIVQQHKQQRGIAFALHALCLLMILVVVGVLPTWWIIAVLIAWALIGAASADSPQQGAKK